MNGHKCVKQQLKHEEREYIKVEVVGHVGLVRSIRKASARNYPKINRCGSKEGVDI